MIKIKTSLISMFLDHLIMCWLLIPPLILWDTYLVPFIADAFEFDLIGKVGFPVMVFLYLNKDFLFGKSIAKRIMSLQIIDNDTNQPADEFKCFLRNMTIPLYPLEVLVSLFSPSRRIGDWIANTREEPYSKALIESWIKEVKQKSITKRTFQMLISGISYVFLLGYAITSWLNYMDSIHFNQ